MTLSGTPFLLDELSQAQPIDLLTRLMQALKSGQTSVEKVNHYYKSKHKDEWQAYARQWLEGTLFAAQKKGFEQMLSKSPDDWQDEVRFWKVWRSAWFCGESVGPSMEDFYGYRISKQAWRLTLEEMQGLSGERLADLRRKFEKQRETYGWSW